MTDRPDLPGLERVTSRGVMSQNPTPLLIGIIAVLVMFIIGIYLAAFSHQRLLLVTHMVSIILGALVLQLILDWVLLSFQWSWRTDEGGIRASGLLGTRSMRWADVERVETRRIGRVRGMRVVLSGRGEGFLVPLRDHILIASIWQHLRRAGKSDGVSLPAAIEPLWRPVPDDIPAEMTLDIVPPPSLLGSLFKPVVLLGMAVLLVVLVLRGAGPENSEQWLWFAFIIFLIALKAPEVFLARPARRVSVFEDHLEAETPFGGVSVPWTSVRGLMWDMRPSMFHNRNLVYLRTGLLRSVRIVWAPDDKHAVRLVLAIVRHVRSANPQKLIDIPNEVPEPRPADARR